MQNSLSQPGLSWNASQVFQSSTDLHVMALATARLPARLRSNPGSEQRCRR